MYTVIVADDEKKSAEVLLEKYAGKNWDFVWLERLKMERKHWKW